MNEPVFLMLPHGGKSYYLMRKEWHEIQDKVHIWRHSACTSEPSTSWAAWEPGQIQLPLGYFIGD